MPENNLELPSILEEAKSYCADNKSAQKFLELVLDYEKGQPHSFKREISNYLEECARSNT